jgi:hypothetical protein
VWLRKILFCLLIGTCIHQVSQGQIILQLEIYRVPQAVKFYPGDRISFKTNDYHDEWRHEVIERLVYSDSLIITNMGMVRINDVIAFRTYNGTVNAFSKMLMTFGTVWLGYGGIAALTANFQFTTGTLAIGGGAILSGWLLKKLFYKNTYKLGKKHRVRIIDISWPAPAILGP